MKHKLPAFDVLVDLARNDPERLERLRRKLTSDIIESAPTEQRRKRLAGLQFRVDMERKKARSPLQATIKISEMMCQSLAELHRSMVTPLSPDTDHQEIHLQDTGLTLAEAKPGAKGNRPLDADKHPADEQTCPGDNKTGNATSNIVPFPSGTPSGKDTDH